MAIYGAKPHHVQTFFNIVVVVGCHLHGVNYNFKAKSKISPIHTGNGAGNVQVYLLMQL